MTNTYDIEENELAIKRTKSFSSETLRFLLDSPTSVRVAACSIIEVTWN